MKCYFPGKIMLSVQTTTPRLVMHTDNCIKPFCFKTCTGDGRLLPLAVSWQLYLGASLPDTAKYLRGFSSMIIRL